MLKFKKMYLSFDLYEFQICSACKNGISFKIIRYNRVLFTLNISITRKKINKQICF